MQRFSISKRDDRKSATSFMVAYRCTARMLIHELNKDNSTLSDTFLWRADGLEQFTKDDDCTLRFGKYTVMVPPKDTYYVWVENL